MNYDVTNWNLIIGQLLSNHQQISLINRAQLLDDSLNMARINALPYAVPLSLTRYLTVERDFLPWYSGLYGLKYLDDMYIRTAGYGDFKVRHFRPFPGSLLVLLVIYVIFDTALFF